MFAWFYFAQAYLAEILPEKNVPQNAPPPLPVKRRPGFVDTRARLWLPVPFISAAAETFVPAPAVVEVAPSAPLPVLAASAFALVVVEARATLFVPSPSISAQPELDDSFILADDAEIEELLQAIFQ